MWIILRKRYQSEMLKLFANTSCAVCTSHTKYLIPVGITVELLLLNEHSLGRSAVNETKEKD